MATFNAVPLDEAKEKTGADRRGRILQEYRGYLDRLPQGLAGKLTPLNGETGALLHRRLGRAAKAAGVKIVRRRNGDTVYFWRREARRPSRRLV